MSVVLCPRCQEPYLGSVTGTEWLVCRRCNHRWLPSPPLKVVGTEDQPGPPRSAIPVESPSPVVRSAKPEEPSPVESSEPTPVKKSKSGTNEYTPDETGDLRRRTLALTSRRDIGSMSPGHLPIQKGAPPPPTEKAATTPKPSPEAMPPTPPNPSYRDILDPDLFERMEHDAQVSRSRQRTIAELSGPTAQDVGVPSYQATCPVCGHSFLSNRPKNEPQPCPQCHTLFDLEKGHVVSGSGQVADGGDVLIGRILRGCQIDRKVGEGGMGSVYHAQQLSLERSVAVKVLPPDLARNQNFIQRFEREAKSLARINHPNILHIYDFGEDQQLGIYFMIIEFVEGRDLGDILHERYTLSQVEVLDIVRQAAMGLEMAAAKGVIHRDIKPDNLMLTNEGICKVSDFGLAKGHESEREVTSIGVRVGTPAFMSPEQCDGIEVDFHSDIYNLGCTAFLALTGHLPFDANTPFAIMLKHKHDPIPTLTQYNPNLHPRVEALVRHMLAKKPEDRFDSLHQLIDEVEQTAIAVAGTASILRKTRAAYSDVPDLEVVERAKLSSQDKRDLSPVEPLAQLSLAPVGSVATPAAPLAEGEIPEWLKPVERSAPTKSSSTVTVPPPAADRSGAKRSSASLAPPPAGDRPSRRSSTGHPSPAPGEAASARKSGQHEARDPRGKFSEAAKRSQQQEAAALKAEGDRLAAAGRLDEAASAWKKAAILVPKAHQSQLLMVMAGTARKRSGLRKALLRLLMVVILLALLLVNAWMWTPLVHNALADRELAAIEAIASPALQLSALEQFKRQTKPYFWYEYPLRTSYQIKAVARATELAGKLRVTPVPIPPPPPPPPPTQAPNPVNPDLQELERRFQDETVAWAEVRDQAKRMVEKTTGKDRERVQAMLAEAERQLVAMTTDLDAIKTAWATGHQGEANERAESFRRSHPRAGTLTPTMLPARVEVVDADIGRLPAGVRVMTQAKVSPEGTDGVFGGPAAVAAGELRFCRYLGVPVEVQVSSPGFRTERLVVPASTETQEQVFKVALHPGMAWGRQIATNPEWLRLHSQDGRTVLVRGPSSLMVLRLADGEIQSSLTREELSMPVSGAAIAGWTTLWDVEPERIVAGTTDGVVLSLRVVPKITVSDILRPGHLPPSQLPVVAFHEKELTLQPGRRATFLIESAQGSMRLLAATATKDLWSFTDLRGVREPALWFREDQVLVMDDQKLVLMDEAEGRQIDKVVFAGPRSGWPLSLAKGALVAVPTTSGIFLYRLPQAGANRIEVVIDELLTTDGNNTMMTASGDTLLISRADRKLQLLAWKGQRSEREWISSLPMESGVVTVLTLGQDYALVADDHGVICLFARANGVLQRRISHGTALACPPLVLPGCLVVADRDGRVTNYQLPPVR
jgi:serine/threonine protein kinase